MKFGLEVKSQITWGGIFNVCRMKMIYNHNLSYMTSSANNIKNEYKLDMVADVLNSLRLQFLGEMIKVGSQENFVSRKNHVLGFVYFLTYCQIYLTSIYHNKLKPVIF